MNYIPYLPLVLVLVILAGCAIAIGTNNVVTADWTTTREVVPSAKLPEEILGDILPPPAASAPSRNLK